MAPLKIKRNQPTNACDRRSNPSCKCFASMKTIKREDGFAFMQKATAIATEHPTGEDGFVCIFISAGNEN